jgi:hypothetical protein
LFDSTKALEIVGTLVATTIHARFYSSLLDFAVVSTQ